jgi:hypothetical protein
MLKKTGARQEEVAKNPFLDMFNDSVFTRELMETMEQETMDPPALDTSWSVKIEVKFE